MQEAASVLSALLLVERPGRTRPADGGDVQGGVDPLSGGPADEVACLAAVAGTVRGQPFVDVMFCGEGFRAEGEVRLPGAHVGRQLSLNGAHLANPGNNALTADRITVDGAMFSGEGFRAEGVRLLSAHVIGSLLLNGAHLVNARNDALTADQISVDDDVFCVEGFRAEGGVRLSGVHIGGQLALNGAHLANPGNNALTADEITVGGGRPG